ncbi:hypothetical protein DFR38_11725 [Aquitalea magnusonii]|uniref:Uncharacterized protein n=1 Tax=Aquitalea magnusonii TaxID=332411 RepID=A0A318JR84_9NEIS|nr:hypothetical protein DFR38_11725 [Aquitalea magnusonii]
MTEDLTFRQACAARSSPGLSCGYGTTPRRPELHRYARPSSALLLMRLGSLHATAPAATATSPRRGARRQKARSVLRDSADWQSLSLSEKKTRLPYRVRAGGCGIDGKAAEAISESKGPALPGPVPSQQITWSAACSPERAPGLSGDALKPYTALSLPLDLLLTTAAASAVAASRRWASHQAWP